MSEPLLIAKSPDPIVMLPAMANRHGLIAGATGTGKTVSLQTLAERFSDAGVPVFMADVKGDLAGLSQPAGAHPKVEARIQQLGLEDYKAQAYPVVFWDVFGELGHPARATVSEMGPLLPVQQPPPIWVVSNPRLRDGKDIHYLEHNVVKVIWPLDKLGLIEVLESQDEESLIGFVRE